MKVYHYRSLMQNELKYCTPKYEMGGKNMSVFLNSHTNICVSPRNVAFVNKTFAFFASEHKVSQKLQNICKEFWGERIGFVSEHKVCWQNANICEKTQIPSIFTFSSNLPQHTHLDVSSILQFLVFLDTPALGAMYRTQFSGKL